METTRTPSRASGHSRGRAPTIAFVAALLALGLGAFNLLTVVTTGDHGLLASPDAWLPLSGSLLGWLVVRHEPRNPLGWLLVAMALSSALFAAAALALSELSLTGAAAGAAAFLTAWVWVPSYLIAFTFVPLLFPNGRGLNRFWSWVVRAAAVLIVLETLLLGFGTVESTEDGVDNPLALEPVVAITDTVGSLLFLALAAFVVLGMASLIHRAVRAQGVERVQMACVVVAVAAGFGYYLLAQSGLLLGLLLPAAIAVAILKFRLYDVERFLVRAIVYGGLAGVAALLYIALVLVATGPFGASDELRVQAGALVVAVLVIHPLRDAAMKVARRLVYGRRTSGYATLAHLAEQVGSAVTPDDVLPRMTEAIQTAFAADRVQVTVRLDEGETESCVRESAAAGSESASVVRRTVRHQGEEVGEIVVHRGDALDAEQTAVLDTLAAQAGPALMTVALTAQLRRRIEELRASRARLVAAHDSARRGIERDLHDGAQQGLLALSVELGRVARAVADPDVAARIEGLQETARMTLVELRALAAGTYPSALRELGVAAALRERGEALGPRLEVEDRIGRRLSEDAEAATYFACLEAITNAVKHSGCRTVVVTLTEPQPGSIVFRVEDDGSGFQQATDGRGSGLVGIADRLAALDGELAVSARDGGGTSVVGTVQDGERVPEPV